jgi:hypothetical protein
VIDCAKLYTCGLALQLWSVPLPLHVTGGRTNLVPMIMPRASISCAALQDETWAWCQLQADAVTVV